MNRAEKRLAREALNAAIQVAGSHSALARKVGVTRQAVDAWVRAGCVPPARAREVGSLAGIPLHELRPDFYGPPVDIGQ